MISFFKILFFITSQKHSTFIDILYTDQHFSVNFQNSMEEYEHIYYQK
jgi:hypothetical protein